MKVRGKKSANWEAFMWDMCLNFSCTSESYAHTLLAPFPGRMRHVITGAVDGQENGCSPWRAYVDRQVSSRQKSCSSGKARERILHSIQPEDRSHVESVVGSWWILPSQSPLWPFYLEGIKMSLLPLPVEEPQFLPPPWGRASLLLSSGQIISLNYEVLFLYDSKIL